jgi:BolA family transcriptional regulator, general stress-responsive regulator
MTTAQRIEEVLQHTFSPVQIVIEDESHLHVGHVGAAGGGGHFKVTVISSAFEGLGLIERHRAVYRALASEMKHAVHALALTTRTPDEVR